MHKTLLRMAFHRHLTSMRPLLYLSTAFINTFGITQPDQKSAIRAAWFIAGMLVLVVGVVAVAGGIALHLFFER